MAHPCRTCGACCAYFRVEFYWRETNRADVERAVPVELTEDASDQRRRMKGTSSKHRNRCVALRGKVGESVSCAIYENRSSACRRFEASYENGEPNDRCDQARSWYGLEPLRPRDWHACLGK